MVAHAFHNRQCAAVAHAEAFASHAAYIGCAAGCAVQRHIAGDNIVLRRESAVFRRFHAQDPAGKSFTHIIVAIPFQHQGDSLGQESAKALPRAAGEVDTHAPP